MSRDSSNKRMTIKRKLKFESDGSIIGSGCDPIDGSFEIKGSWRKVGSEYKLRWKEMYDENKVVEIMVSKHWYNVKQKYDVEVEGTLFEGEEFSGRFKSSLDITGYYLLKRAKVRIF